MPKSMPGCSRRGGPPEPLALSRHAHWRGDGCRQDYAGNDCSLVAQRSHFLFFSFLSQAPSIQESPVSLIVSLLALLIVGLLMAVWKILQSS